MHFAFAPMQWPIIMQVVNLVYLNNVLLTNLKDALVGTTHPTGKVDNNEMSVIWQTPDVSGKTTAALDSFAASSSSFFTWACLFLQETHRIRK